MKWNKEMNVVKKKMNKSVNNKCKMMMMILAIKNKFNKFNKQTLSFKSQMPR